MTDQPSYYSIITANVRYDNRLTDSEKLLFAEITSLSNKYGYCTASNGYFAKLYEVTKVTVSRRIANLKECGYLQVEIIREGNEIKQRKIYPLTEMIRPINTNDNTPINNSVNTPIITNVKENNTSNNTTSINNINRIDTLSGNPTSYPYSDVIDYLNERTGKQYKSTTKKNQTVIRARIDEGFNLDDFKKVIDNKVTEWKGTDMEKYLRPETLFGTKFEGYLNQQQSNTVDEDWRKQYEGVF
ncbi:conserved phage C-terminal domain-containing protein [Staphylococcus chromogenes]|uniref:Conserved phage C-terminal domain-containing protein n=1 Tax=Staphylococcus chromogenes TaxID=46126 RepID=A0ABD5AUW1_STACR|nr:conserved phage C-terminal domain-containing protein [Staphylococcus chromogenes]MCE5093496.1 conserved phage C-terminal domain-containing protein [Staphylococcus chromogenes]MDQ7175010.1 conserved phage C-terminal domain-containing protein [Staphylococcus chromogenes]PTG99109.1 alpha/beta hydrolase [Staphylococcus chromogenes]RIL88402.1 alpha/beta hydrolase [Staphylococcus chromogenes]TJY13588.1 alpha/beta hydrolase [Staphylococcus chromogenes]